ncbi:MAG: response regulator transcription factor [Micromonosporaceae bacterium]
MAISAYARSRERLNDICESAADARTLRLLLVEELRRTVGFDAYVWLLTDPDTTVGCAPLADIPPPLLAQLPRLIRLKYLTEVNRWTSLGDEALTLRQQTGGDLSRSLVWRELLGQHGVVDILSIVLRDRFGCWGFLDLWRLGSTGDGGAFGEPATALLGQVRGAVTSALRRAQAAALVGRPPSTRRVGPLVLLLSPELQVLGQTPDTTEYLRQLLPTDGGQPPVPAGAYNVAAQLLAREAGVDDHPAQARVSLPDGLWLSLRAARIDAVGGDRNIAVTIEEASPTERLSLFALAHGLSAREAELLAHLATGADTREVAGRMFLSEHTVQDHLKGIFAKASVRSRRALLSRALGT